MHTAVRGTCPLFFFNDAATTDIYTLSLHDALPIYRHRRGNARGRPRARSAVVPDLHRDPGSRCRQDRKSTRLNSSHPSISYAVFCLKKQRCTQHITNYIHEAQCMHTETQVVLGAEI